MSTKDIFIPKGNRIQAEGNAFQWNYGGDLTKAEDTVFYRSRFAPTGEESWVFAGSNGSGEEGNYFDYLLIVPYVDDNLLEQTYKLGDGQDLHFSHTHSIPAPEGFIGYRTVDADDAELTIRLDPKAGTVHGDFNAKFRNYPDPQGTFQLKRDDQ